MKVSDERRFLLEEKHHGVETPEFLTDLDRLAKGEPVAYIIGWVPFLGCTIFLDSHPLIPRPETEYWAERAVVHASTLVDTKHPQLLQVLDLFAGSGAIGVAILKHLPSARVDFGEIDEKHFPTILKNIRENKLQDHRARMIHTDVWSAVVGSYDLILGNPPYLSKNRMKRIQTSVLRHEPEKALLADDDGFALIEKTIRGLPDHLHAHGAAYVEHEPEHAKRIQDLAKQIGMIAESYPDQYRILRYSKVSFLP